MSIPYPITPEDTKQAETILLGSLLLYPEQGTLVQAVLQPDDFVEDRHQLIYEALQAIPGTSAHDSIHSVKILLSDHELDQIGGEAYLTMLKQQAESKSMSIEDQVSSPQTGIASPHAHAGWRSTPYSYDALRQR